MTGVAAAALFSTADVFAGTPVPNSPEGKRQAAQEFTEGQKAFKAGDFRHAAESFEAAYRDAPHYAALWNAARAWHRADEKTKAANLYEKYLRIAPPKARDRNSAQDALRDLSSQLGRFEIHAVDMTDVKVDDEPIEDLSVYVTPGAHVISAKLGDKVVRKEQKADAGAVVSVALVAEEEKPPPPTIVVAPPPPPSQSSVRFAPPAIIAVGGVLTAAGAAVTIWSGLDTVNAKKSFDNAPSQAGLDAGLSKEHRTNILLGATIGVGAVTSILAIGFTNWSGKKKDDAPPTVGFGFGNVTFKASF